MHELEDSVTKLLFLSLQLSIKSSAKSPPGHQSTLPPCSRRIRGVPRQPRPLLWCMQPADLILTSKPGDPDTSMGSVSGGPPPSKLEQAQDQNIASFDFNNKML